MKKDYKFHGYDFVELFECFEIPYGDEVPHLDYDSPEEEPPKEEEKEITKEDAKCSTWESITERLDKENPNWRAEADEEIRKQEESMKNLQEFIRHHAGQLWSYPDDIPEESELVYQKCIEYLDALIIDSKKWSYLPPIWKGLRKVKDKGTLLQLYADLIPHMWC